MRRAFFLRVIAAIAAAFAVAAEAGLRADAPRVWETGPGHRSAPLTIAPGGTNGFARVLPAASGITFTNLLPESRHLTNQILLNGAGVAAGDVDGDGRCDLFFAGSDGRSALFHNLGDWKFEDVTDAAGVACAGLTATGCALADLDGDGDLDLVVDTVGQGTHVFLNDGKGRFVRAPFVLNEGKGGMSLALGDLDGDGFLDLYIANYRTSGFMDIPNKRATFRKINGKVEMDTLNGRSTSEPDLADRFVVGPRGNIEERGETDLVLRNLGGTNFTAMRFTDGTFLDEAGRPLLKAPMDWGLSVMIRDIDQDGLPDIYVCNDFQSEDRLWLNQGRGRFRLAPKTALRRTSLYSMGVDFADIDHDGRDDFFVVDMLSRDHAQRMRDLHDATPSVTPVGVFDDRPQNSLNTLFLNRGGGRYSEIAQLAGLDASGWSWSCIFLDVDLDGWEDLLVTNGMERAARDLDVADQMKALRASRKLTDAEVFAERRKFPRLATPNLAFRNRGDLTFEEVGHAWGFDTAGVSHGMALADLDGDGDLDVVTNDLNAPAGIYRNDSPAPRIAVRLKGVAPNTRGIGARITVTGGAVPSQSQEVIAGGRYLSSDDPMRTFAAGSATNRLTIEVRWRSGRRSRAAGLAADRVYEFDESAAEVVASVPPAVPAPLFEDVSARLAHRHHEEEFDDFARQPLLPRKFSQLGPEVAWFDCDEDGLDDLVIGSGPGGAMSVHRNDGKGGFTRWENDATAGTVPRDQAGLAAWHPARGDGRIIASSANHEDGLAQGALFRQYALKAKTVEEPIGAIASSPGPVALADIDGDGDLDLFIGGRVVPGRYPAAAISQVFLYEGGRWVPDATTTKVLAQVGMVSGAVFSDLDGDGWPDLVLACDWGPVRVFHNDHGKFSETTRALGLAELTGWWNGVAVGDLDEDGRMDIVASNWGRDTPYQSGRGRPLRIYHGDLDDDGVHDLVEARHDAGLGKYVPERQLGVLAKAMPFLSGRFRSNAAYSTAGIEEILGDRLPRAAVVEATCLETTLFLNRGDHFEAHALPVEAQMSPAFGVAIADLDGDGHDDVVLAQNFFGVQPELPRHDAGSGLVLKGDGRGGLRAMDAGVSGIQIFGEQRGVAVSDHDRDGRLDLAITQNGGATRLFRNNAAKPGLRVRLDGPDANPDAIGASLRLRSGSHVGPRHELHAGSGSGSQDGLVSVLGGPAPANEVLVRWPGGKETVSSVPAGAAEIRVRPGGQVEAVGR